jgi:hypothetical protein
LQECKFHRSGVTVIDLICREQLQKCRFRSSAGTPQPTHQSLPPSKLLRPPLSSMNTTTAPTSIFRIGRRIYSSDPILLVGTIADAIVMDLVSTTMDCLAIAWICSRAP